MTARIAELDTMYFFDGSLMALGPDTRVSSLTGPHRGLLEVDQAETTPDPLGIGGDNGGEGHQEKKISETLDPSEEQYQLPGDVECHGSDRTGLDQRGNREEPGW